MNTNSFFLKTISTAILWMVIVLTSSVSAETFLPIWLGQGQKLSQVELKALQAARPQQIVFLVHGYGVPRVDGEKSLQEASTRIHAYFRQQRVRGAVVGLVWESTSPGDAVPWQAEEAYYKMVQRARGVGHQAARQVILGVAQKFPQAQLSLISHSLGCEVAAAALYPTLTYTDQLPPSLPAYQPQSPLRLRMWGLLGSDLDYDLWWKSRFDFAKSPTQVGLHWMTISSYLGERDQTLLMRKMSRGMAGGSALPRLTAGQWDYLNGQRKLYFDDQDLGESHDFATYSSSQRLARMLSLGEVKELQRLPAQASQLRSWLDHPQLGVRVYALWKLEHLLCGSSQHLADETIENTARLLRNTPIRVRKERKDSPCRSIRDGYWPTEKELIRAGAPADW